MFEPGSSFSKRKSQLFFHTSFHSSTSLIPFREHTLAHAHKHRKSPLHPPVSLPLFFCFMSLKWLHGREAKGELSDSSSPHHYPHFVLELSVSLTHFVSHCPCCRSSSFQHAPSLPPSFFLPANSLFLLARRWDKGRKAPPTLAATWDYLYPSTGCLTLFLAVLVIFVAR